VFAFVPKPHWHDGMFKDIFRKWPLVEAYDRLKVRLSKLFV